MKKLCNYVTKQLSNCSKGTIALISILIITATTLIIVLSVNLLSLGEMAMGFLQTKSLESFHFSNGCIEEALIRLKKDSNYSSGTLSLNNKTCNIIVIPNLQQRIITSIANVDNKIRKIEMIVEIIPNGLKVISWKEY